MAIYVKKTRIYQSQITANSKESEVKRYDNSLNVEIWKALDWYKFSKLFIKKANILEEEGIRARGSFSVLSGGEVWINKHLLIAFWKNDINNLIVANAPSMITSAKKKIYSFWIPDTLTIAQKNKTTVVTGDE